MPKASSGLAKLRTLLGGGSEQEIHDAYHHWYYRSQVWKTTSWLGVPTQKSVSDMWNYQEIITELRPSLLVEFGTAFGGSALFFATVVEALKLDCAILTVDIHSTRRDPSIDNNERIEIMVASSTDEAVADRISELRRSNEGPMFAILDSNHRADHVYGELNLLHPLSKPGDYLIVEDGNVNGHPVIPDYGPGPYEATERFLEEHPNAYERDVERERRFGFSFAPGGFLRRR